MYKNTSHCQQNMITFFVPPLITSNPRVPFLLHTFYAPKKPIENGEGKEGGGIGKGGGCEWGVG